MLCWDFHPWNILTVCFIACYYPFGIPCRLYDVEEIYINVLVPFILKKLPGALWSACLVKRRLTLKGLVWEDELFPVSAHVSISIYTLELEKKSSIPVTYTLFLNAQQTFPPVKHPYCVLRGLLLSIQYPNVEEIYINVLVPFILKKLPIAFWSVLSLNKN